MARVPPPGTLAVVVRGGEESRETEREERVHRERESRENQRECDTDEEDRTREHHSAIEGQEIQAMKVSGTDIGGGLFDKNVSAGLGERKSLILSARVGELVEESAALSSDDFSSAPSRTASPSLGFTKLSTRISCDFCLAANAAAATMPYCFCTHSDMTAGRSERIWIRQNIVRIGRIATGSPGVLCRSASLARTIYGLPL